MLVEIFQVSDKFLDVSFYMFDIVMYMPEFAVDVIQ